MSLTRRLQDAADAAEALADNLARGRDEAEALAGAGTFAPAAPFGPPPVAGAPRINLAPGAPRGQGGAGAASTGGAGSGGSRQDVGASFAGSLSGGAPRSIDYLEQNCRRIRISIPEPGNLFAAITGATIEVDAWECPDGSVYLMPGQDELLPERAGRGTGGGPQRGTAAGRNDWIRRGPVNTGDIDPFGTLGQRGIVVSTPGVTRGNAVAAASAATAASSAATAEGVQRLVGETQLARQQAAQGSDRVAAAVDGLRTAILEVRHDLGLLGRAD
jgi:hypothetical protein